MIVEWWDFLEVCAERIHQAALELPLYLVARQKTGETGHPTGEWEPAFIAQADEAHDYQGQGPSTLWRYAALPLYGADHLRPDLIAEACTYVTPEDEEDMRQLLLGVA